ncbi:MAG: RNA polymerase sigma factor [Gemmatales bacterium]|nr:MAG: RNA polymerase sigma factor [Gemmatales bacterium]
MHPDESKLVWEAQNGRQQAFAALAEAYWPKVYRWLFRLSDHPHLAEDLTQEAFLKAWSALPTLAEGSRFRSWLFAIARNCFLQAKRRGRDEEKLPETIASPIASPEGAALEEETRLLLESACRRLPEHYRAAFLLWTYEDMSYHEIAEVLGTTEVTARWRVCKARRFLLSELKPYLEQHVS